MTDHDHAEQRNRRFRELMQEGVTKVADASAAQSSAAEVRNAAFRELSDELANRPASRVADQRRALRSS